MLPGYLYKYYSIKLTTLPWGITWRVYCKNVTKGEGKLINLRYERGMKSANNTSVTKCSECNKCDKGNKKIPWQVKTVNFFLIERVSFMKYFWFSGTVEILLIQFRVCWFSIQIFYFFWYARIFVSNDTGMIAGAFCSDFWISLGADSRGGFSVLAGRPQGKVRALGRDWRFRIGNGL